MRFKTRWFENSAMRTAVEGVAAMIASKTMGFEIEVSNHQGSRGGGDRREARVREKRPKTPAELP